MYKQIDSNLQQSQEKLASVTVIENAGHYVSRERAELPLPFRILNMLRAIDPYADARGARCGDSQYTSRTSFGNLFCCKAIRSCVMWCIRRYEILECLISVRTFPLASFPAAAHSCRASHSCSLNSRTVLFILYLHLRI